ncbi:unnamed protein product [Closterium sp. NIES-53]
MPFLFPDLGTFDYTADLVTHLRSLNASYRAACTEAELATAAPPVHITIHFIITSLPDRLAHVRDAILQKHPSALTIEVLETALKDIESNIHSAASASAAVVPPLFQGFTVPQLPTFIASLASTASPASDETAAMSIAIGRARGRGVNASSGGGTGGGTGPAGPTGGGAGPVGWYTSQQQQQSQQQQPQQGH